MSTIRVISIGVLLAIGAVAQQDMGIITGVVRDTTDAMIPGAAVTAVNKATNEIWHVETSGAGTYTVGPVRVGTYDITVEAAGFKKCAWQNIELHAQDRARADFKLEVGRLEESVVVHAESPTLQVENSSIAHVIGLDAIESLPLNGRNFQQLAWLASGVSPNTGPNSRDTQSGFNAHGQRILQNTFSVDGIDNTTNVQGVQDLKLQIIVPSVDAVSEFKVQTSNFSAEFGTNSGAVMIVNIRSGSNQFHGSAFEYLRNNLVDARNTFSFTGENGLRRNQFGATLGGPIRRNRTFFFGAWEGLRIHQAQSPTAIVPTASERSGLFSSSLGTVRDPATGQPFPGNQIPNGRFDTTAALMVGLWPQPNFGGFGTRDNFISSPPWTTQRDEVDIRVDHNLSEKDRLFGRVSIIPFHAVQSTVFPEPARGDQSNFTAATNYPARGVAFSYIRVLSPRWLNEFRYGLMRLLAYAGPETETNLPSRELVAKYGIRGIPTDDPRLVGLPAFNFSGPISYTGLGERGSSLRVSQDHQFLDNISWNHGTHNFKFGTDLRFNRSDSDVLNTLGSFSFTGTFTGNSFADFLLGYAGSASLGTELSAEMRFRNYMFYAQDDWKLTSRLTLNLGLRYELNTPWVDKHDNMTQLDLNPGPNFGQIMKAGSCGGSYLCRSFRELNTNNWAPRTGFAWQLDSRTALRSAAGVFFGTPRATPANTLGGNNFPYTRSVTVTSTATIPALLLHNGIPDGFLGSTTTPPANLNWVQWSAKFPNTKVYQWNLSLQRELKGNMSLTLAYVGSASNYLEDVYSSYNWNGSSPGPAATEKARRPIPNWNRINLETPFGHSGYHGLDIQLERRFSQGLLLSAAYTWSHSIDDVPEQWGSAGGNIQDFHNWQASRSSSGFDIRQRFASGLLYDLPAGRGRRWLNHGSVTNFILGGWQLSSIISIQSGLPFSVTTPNAATLLGSTIVGDWWPDRIQSAKLDNPAANAWFNRSAFVAPQSSDKTWHLGNAGRNILNSQGLFNVDAGLMKSFAITEKVHLQFRGEAFNLTNSAILSYPNNTFGSPDFAKVTSTINTARQLQFALRLSF